MHNKEPGPIEQFKGISSHTKRFFKRQIITWFEQNGRRFPWRESNDPYHILLAEIILQQTDARKVSLIYSDFIQCFPAVSVLAEASSDKVHEFIFKIGLHYRTERLVNIAKDINAKFEGQIPCLEQELLTLVGVGRYIANAVLINACGMRRATVDTNIVRILERFFDIHSPRSRPRTDPELWEVATSLLPQNPSNCRRWNYALIDFGALICTHYNPKCSVCVCNRMCIFASTQPRQPKS